MDSTVSGKGSNVAVQAMLEACHANKGYVLQVGVPLPAAIWSVTVPVVFQSGVLTCISNFWVASYVRE